MYTIMHTGKPFATAIPEDAWGVRSKHKTLTAAFKALLREYADMVRYCGGSGWSDHFYIQGDDRKYSRQDAIDWRQDRDFEREYRKYMRKGA